MLNSINHVAFIMDGNRRWGKQNSVSQLQAYNFGANKLEEIISVLPTYNVKCVTFYAFSKENWQREASEISTLKTLLVNFLTNKVSKFITEEVKFICIGNYKEFGVEVANKIEELQNKTCNFTKLTVCMALNYSAKEEVVDAVNTLINLNLPITPNNISNNLYTSNLPNLDLIIRTGGHNRLSNFLLWQSAYSEIFFIDKLWPDFTLQDLQNIFNNFKNIQRNYGK